MAKMNLSKFSNSVKKSLGKEFSHIDYGDIKGIIKGNNLMGSSVEEATSFVKKTINNRSEIEKAFSKGTKIGEDLIVPTGGKTHKSYNRLIGNKGQSSEEAIERIVKQNKTPDPNRIFEIEEANNAREKIINKNRVQSDKYRKNQTRREIQREIELNYKDNELANNIADKIEDRGGFVGKGPMGSATERLQGRTPDVNNIVSTRELKKNRFNDKESYMKWSQGQKYDEAIEAFKKEDYNNPLLKNLSDKGIDVKQLNVDNLQALRQETINNVSASDMKLTDWMGYHKVPQKATGVVGTAWLVNKMASGGGQQTNSQLYGQSPY